MYGLLAEEIEQIKQVFGQYPEIDKALLYGSRAKGNFRPGSDIDLTLFGQKLSTSKLLEIENVLDDLLLPFKMDLSIHHHIQNPELLDHIQRVGKVFYESERQKLKEGGGMSEWKETTLGDIINLRRGHDLPKRKRNEGDVPIISSSGITGYHNDYKAVGPGVVTGRYGTIGQVFYVKGQYWPLNTTLYVDDFRSNDPLFVSYFLRTIDFDKYNDKSTVPGINRNHLHLEEVSIPPLKEQRAIASVLSSLDDKIDLLHRQNQTLEQMAETLFRQWFVEEADEGWEEVTLKSLCKVITKGTTPTSLKRQFVEVGINFIKVNCIDDNGNFIYDKFNFIDDETHHVALKRSILQEGDLLYSIAGTIGRISEVTHEVLPANVNQALAILRVNTDIINPYYVKYSLKDPNITFDLHSKIVHAVQPNLSLGEIGSTLIPLPDKETRQKFNNVINPIQAKIKSNQTQIRTLTTLRDTLLPKLMSGEIRIN